MKNIQLTCAHALVKFLIAQKTLIDGKKAPLFPGVFGIFGHGNVACLGQALQENQKDLPISSIKFKDDILSWAANENSKKRFKSKTNLWTLQASL